MVHDRNEEVGEYYNDCSNRLVFSKTQDRFSWHTSWLGVDKLRHIPQFTKS